MTKRRTEQKDVGEPAFSPDGRYLYYSKDATPGQIFEYNKDPNGEIYVDPAARSRDRRDHSTFVGGAGRRRAARRRRPTASGSPSSAACATRACCYVLDLASGDERPLYDGLDRDLQETWAIHGVYPGHGVDAGLASRSCSGRRAASTGSTWRRKQVARHSVPRRATRAASPRRCASRWRSRPTRFTPRCCAG